MTERKKQYVSRQHAQPVFFLCLLFGIFGIHRFYLQKFRSGLIQLFTLGGLGLWTMRDLYQIARGNFTDRRGYRIERWK